jgi:S-adenosylmethionine hydrolase
MVAGCPSPSDSLYAGYVILEISVTIIDIFGNIWTNISEIIIKALCELREIYFSTFLFAV